MYCLTSDVDVTDSFLDVTCWGSRDFITVPTPPLMADRPILGGCAAAKAAAEEVLLFFLRPTVPPGPPERDFFRLFRRFLVVLATASGTG